MKKVRIVILATLLTFTMSLPYAAFAYDYSTANESTSTDTLSDTYYNEDTSTREQTEKDTISIAFTNDIDSSLSKLAKLSTYVGSRTDKYPLSYLFDAGNYSMGVPYNTIFESEAAELRTMGEVGYDATTIGGSELLKGSDGLASMLKTAKKSGDTLPAVVAANIKTDSQLQKAFKSYGVKDYKVINKYGTKVAVFGIIGKDSFDSASCDGLSIADPVQTAKDVVSEIKKNEDVDMIVCLANTGNGSSDTDQSEAVKIAKGTDDIDLIICGNSKSALDEPIEANGTEIVASGQNADQVGTITFKKSGKSYKFNKYKLVTVKGSTTADSAVSSLATKFKSKLDSDYFSKFGFTYSEKLTKNKYDFTSLSSFGKSKGDDPLGDLVADSYLYSAKKAKVKADVAVMSVGSLSDTIPTGKITTGDAFNVLSKGTGNDGKTGYPLVKFYLMGSELKALAEGGSKVAKSNNDSRLYFGGLDFTYNPHRIVTNRVYDAELVSLSGKKSTLNEKDQYCVVSDIKTAEKLTEITSKHHVKVTPKTKSGSEIKDFNDQIIDKSGNELKAWSGLATYLKSFDGTVPTKYSNSDGRMTYDSSFNPSHLVKQPNRMFGIVTSVVVIVIAVILLLIAVLFNVFGRVRYGRNYKRRRKYFKQQKKQKPIFSRKR